MDDIRQKDFSNVSIREMSLEERKEIKRRFTEFAEVLQNRKADCVAEQSEPPKKVVKWNPRTMVKAQEGK